MYSSKLSAWITVRVVDNKALVLSCIRGEDTIKLFGSTMSTSISHHRRYQEGEKHFTVYPKENKGGVVAICVTASKGNCGHKGREETVSLPAFLKVQWKGTEGKLYPFIDLEEPWVPTEHAGQTRESGVEVEVRGIRFSTHNYREFGTKGEERSPLYVPDGDLLCKYLFGMLHSSDVLHAAVQQKLEPLAKVRVGELIEELIKEKRVTLKVYGELRAKIEDCVAIRERMQQLIQETITLRAQANLLIAYFQNQDRLTGRLLALLNRIPMWRRSSLVKELIPALQSVREAPAPTAAV